MILRTESIETPRSSYSNMLMSTWPWLLACSSLVVMSIKVALNALSDQPWTRMARPAWVLCKCLSWCRLETSADWHGQNNEQTTMVDFHQEREVKCGIEIGVSRAASWSGISGIMWEYKMGGKYGHQHLDTIYVFHNVGGGLWLVAAIRSLSSCWLGVV